MRYLLIFLVTCNVNAKMPLIYDLLHTLEHITGCKYKVSSHNRTRRQNRRVGGVSDSMHLRKDKALDIYKNKDCKLKYSEIKEYASILFTTVIVYKRHIHLDLRVRYVKYIR